MTTALEKFLRTPGARAAIAQQEAADAQARTAAIRKLEDEIERVEKAHASTTASLSARIDTATEDFAQVRQSYLAKEGELNALVRQKMQASLSHDATVAELTAQLRDLEAGKETP